MIRPIWKVISTFLIAIILLGLLPITAYAASPNDIVIGNNYILKNGQTLNNDLFILGGTANLMDGSIVNGNIYLLGGNLSAAGTVHGEIIVLGGTMKMASTFSLTGDITSAGASVSADPGAQINGRIYSGENIQYFILPYGVRFPNLSRSFDPLFRIAAFFLQLFLWTVVALIVAMFIPNHLRRTAQAAITQPLVSGGLGLLTAIVLPILLVLFVITICLIPIAVLGALILILAWAFGLIAVGQEVGKRISIMFKQVWHPALTAGLGTLVLMTILNSLEAAVPCVGWIPKVIVSLIGLGAVLLTQFGIKPYSSTPNSPIQITDTPPPV